MEKGTLQVHISNTLEQYYHLIISKYNAYGSPGVMQFAVIVVVIDDTGNFVY